jgi:hypothetical protein
LDVVKDGLSAAQSLCTIAAIIIGGIWTWYLFDWLSQKGPTLYVQQSIKTTDLGSDLTNLHIDFDLKNNGKVTTYLVCLDLYIKQMLPLKPELAKSLQDKLGELRVDTDVDWPTLKFRRINMAKGTTDGMPYLVEVGNEAIYPVDIVIPQMDKAGKPITAIEIVSYFQPGRPGDLHCRTARANEKGGMVGTVWETSTTLTVPHGAPS